MKYVTFKSYIDSNFIENMARFSKGNHQFNCLQFDESTFIWKFYVYDVKFIEVGDSRNWRSRKPNLFQISQILKNFSHLSYLDLSLTTSTTPQYDYDINTLKMPSYNHLIQTLKCFSSLKALKLYCSSILYQDLQALFKTIIRRKKLEYLELPMLCEGESERTSGDLIAKYLYSLRSSKSLKTFKTHVPLLVYQENFKRFGQIEQMLQSFCKIKVEIGTTDK